MNFQSTDSKVMKVRYRLHIVQYISCQILHIMTVNLKKKLLSMLLITEQSDTFKNVRKGFFSIAHCTISTRFFDEQTSSKLLHLSFSNNRFIFLLDVYISSHMPSTLSESLS